MAAKPLNYPTWSRAFIVAVGAEAGGVALIALLWLLARALGFDVNPHSDSISMQFLLMITVIVAPAALFQMNVPDGWPEWLRWTVLALLNLAYLTVLLFAVMGWRAWQRPRWPVESSLEHDRSN